MEPIVIPVVGDPAAALAIAQQQLAELKYRVAPGADGWSGTAEVGSALLRVFAGGFSRRMKVSYALTQDPTPGVSVLTIKPETSGMSGGALGMSKAKKEMASIAERVHGAIHQAGLLAR